MRSGPAATSRAVTNVISTPAWAVETTFVALAAARPRLPTQPPLTGVGGLNVVPRGRTPNTGDAGGERTAPERRI